MPNNGAEAFPSLFSRRIKHEINGTRMGVEEDYRFSFIKNQS